MLCYHCGKKEADVFCEECCENTQAWNPSDTELLKRLGVEEVLAWRKAYLDAQDFENVDLLDDSGLTGISRWVSAYEYATTMGVSIDTVRRAVHKGLEHRRVRRHFEILKTAKLPLTEKTGPHNNYVVREPSCSCWWEGTTRAQALAELRKARNAGLSLAKVYKNGELFLPND
jgi:hypothetical protein